MLAINEVNPNFANDLSNQIYNVININANSGKTDFDRSIFNTFIAKEIYDATKAELKRDEDAYNKKLFMEKLNGLSLQEYINKLNPNPAVNVKSINIENGKAVIGKFKVNYYDPSIVILDEMNFMIGTEYNEGIEKFILRVYEDNNYTDYEVIKGQKLEENLHNKDFSILIDSSYYDELVGGKFKLNMHFSLKGDVIANWTRYVGYVCYEDEDSGIQIVLANGKKVPVNDIEYEYNTCNNGLEAPPYYSNLKINKLKLRTIISSDNDKGIGYLSGDNDMKIYNYDPTGYGQSGVQRMWGVSKDDSQVAMLEQRGGTDYLKDELSYYYYFSNGARVDKKLVVLEIKPVSEDNWDDEKYDVIGEGYYIKRSNVIGDAYNYELYDKCDNKIIESLGNVATIGLNKEYYVYYDKEKGWKSSPNKPQIDGFVEVNINGMTGWLFEDYYNKEHWLQGYNNPTGVNAYHIPHTQNLMTADEFEVTTSSDKAELEVIYNPEINVPRSIVLTKLNGTSDEKMAGVRFFITVTGKGKLYVYDSKCSSQSKLRMIDENELNNILSGVIDERYILTTSTDGKVYIDNIYESDLQGDIIIKSYEMKSKSGFNTDSDPIITTVADNNDGTFKVNTVLPRGDVSGDGQIDADDAILIMKYDTFMSWINTIKERKNPDWETDWNKDADFSFLINDEDVVDAFEDEFEGVSEEFRLGYLINILKYGDMNNDGIVDSSDAACLLQNYANKITNSTSYEMYSIPINIPNYPTYTFVLNKISSDTAAGIEAAQFKIDLKYKNGEEDVIETYDAEDIITNDDGKITISLSEDKCKGEIGIYLREKEVPGYKSIKGLVRYVFRVEHIKKENEESGYFKYFEPIEVSLFLRNHVNDASAQELDQLESALGKEWEKIENQYGRLEDENGEYVKIVFTEENNYTAVVPVISKDDNKNEKIELGTVRIAPGNDNQIIELTMENNPDKDNSVPHELKLRKVYYNGTEYVDLSGAKISYMLDRIENGDVVSHIVSDTVDLTGNYFSILPPESELSEELKEKLTAGWYRLTVQENEAPSGCEKLMGNFTYDYFVDKDGKITSKSGNSNALFETNGSEANVNCLALDFVNEKVEDNLITTMNLAGTVFVEGYNGKGDSKNNILDDGEGFGGENVKVTLWEAGYYDANGTLQLYSNPVMPEYEFMPTYENATTYNGNRFNESHSTTEYAKLFQAFEENLGDDLKNWKDLGEKVEEDLNGKAVTLYQQNLNAIPDEFKRTNPTVTDSTGNYRFEGLNPTKKYFVTFEYNGMLYQTVTFNEGGATYNTKQWVATSKVEDTKVNGVTAITRNSMNNNFVEIGSYPKGYKVNDALFKADTYLTKDGNDYYNITFTNEDLIETTFGEAGNIYEIINNKIKKSSYYKKSSYRDNLKGLSYNSEDDELNKKFKCMVQFIYDCTVTADTRANGNTINTGVDSGYNVNGNIYYPVYEQFSLVGSSKDYSISNGEFLKNDMGYPVIYDGQEHINCGLKLRAPFDFQISKSVVGSKITVGGQELNIKADENGVKAFTQNVYASDIAVDYQNAEYDIQQYITYNITVKNESSVGGTVMELVDYMDDRYEFISCEGYGSIAKDKSIYGNKTEKEVSKQSTKYITFENDEEYGLSISANDEKSIQVTYKLLNARDELIKCGLLKGDDYRLKANNYVEINGYKNAMCKVADSSTPGNLVDSRITNRESKETENAGEIRKGSIIKREPDEAQAPEIIISIYKDQIRKLMGIAFEDKHSENTNSDSVYENLDGIFDSSENVIEGVKVTLWQKNLENNEWEVAKLYDGLDENGKPTWKTETELRTDENGKYVFENYTPGEFYVEFLYGDIEKTVLASEGKTSYNGQDYQSTINNWISSEKFWYNDIFVESVASDLYGDKETKSTRAYVEDYSSTIRNHKAEVLNSYKISEDLQNESTKELLEELMNETNVKAQTSNFTANVEYVNSDYEYETLNSEEYQYLIDDINLGLTERPKSKLVVNKEVVGVKLTVQGREEVLSQKVKNGEETVIESNANSSGVIWQEATTDNTTGYGNGLIWLQKDDDTISGGLLEVTYRISIENEGEWGYNTSENSIYADYYSAMTSDSIKTSADILIDYVDSNYNYDPNYEFEVEGEIVKNSDYWSEVKAEDIQKDGIDTLINNVGIDVIKEIPLGSYEKILKTDKLKREIEPKQKYQYAYLTLTKVLSKDASDAEFEYNNAVEIVETSNSIGRKDCYSIPGNFSPMEKTSKPGNLIELVTIESIRPGYEGDYPMDTADDLYIEYDTDLAETIVISNPTGEENPKQYYILAIAIVALLGIGVFGIKKLVLDTSNF